MSCFVIGSLFTKVLPLCRCLTFLKANNSPGLQTGIVDLWKCAQCAGGPLHEVFVYLYWIDLFCCRSSCCSWCGVCGGPERSLWLCHLCYICCVHRIGHCIGIVWYCFCCKSWEIWKTLEVPSDVPVFILKLGTFSPFTMFSSG